MSAPDFQAEARELNTTLTQLRVLRAMPGDCEARIAAALRAAYEAGAAKERERIAVSMETRADSVRKHRCAPYEACIYCDAARELDAWADEVCASGGNK